MRVLNRVINAMLTQALLLLCVTTPIVVLGFNDSDISGSQNQTEGITCQICGTSYTPNCTKSNNPEGECRTKIKGHQVDLCTKVVGAHGRIVRSCGASTLIEENYVIRLNKKWVPIETNKCYKNVKISRYLNTKRDKNVTSEYRQFCTCQPKNSTWNGPACNSCPPKINVFNLVTLLLLLTSYACLN